LSWINVGETMRGHSAHRTPETAVSVLIVIRGWLIASDRIDLRVGRELKFPTMRVSSIKGSIEGLRRKLRAVAAVVEDPAATEHEKANAQAAKARLQHRLREAGSPAGDWTDNVFRLGRWAKEMGKSISSVSPKGDWTDNAQRFGKALRRGYKSWLSD
jgi:hypothetical protein